MPGPREAALLTTHTTLAEHRKEVCRWYELRFVSDCELCFALGLRGTAAKPGESNTEKLGSQIRARFGAVLYWQWRSSHSLTRWSKSGLTAKGRVRPWWIPE